jgi:hypothetical protein
MNADMEERYHYAEIDLERYYHEIVQYYEQGEDTDILR